MVVAHSGRQQLRRAAARLPAYLRWAEGIIGVEPCQSQDLLNQMNIYHDKAWNKSMSEWASRTDAMMEL